MSLILMIYNSILTEIDNFSVVVMLFSEVRCLNNESKVVHILIFPLINKYFISMSLVSCFYLPFSKTVSCSSVLYIYTLGTLKLQLS